MSNIFHKLFINSLCLATRTEKEHMEFVVIWSEWTYTRACFSKCEPGKIMIAVSGGE